MEKTVRIESNSLYIEPISACNLHCRLCYGNVINGPERRLIPADIVLDFVRRFMAASTLPVTICWCGTGEVFLHPDFPDMINRLLAGYGEERLSLQIQTNGTLARWHEFDSLRRLDFRVSVDGLRQFHEWNRGENTYDRTLGFCREAVERGCRSLVVRMLLTQENIDCLDEFQQDLREQVGAGVEIWVNIPYTNQVLDRIRPLTSCIAPHPIEDGNVIKRSAALRILDQKYLNRYPLDEDPHWLSNYASVTTEGVFSCCNRIVRLGETSTEMSVILARLAASADACRACPIYPCG